MVGRIVEHKIFTEDSSDATNNTLSRLGIEQVSLVQLHVAIRLG